MRVCEVCRKELGENMICVSINVYGSLREKANDVSGLGKVDAELDYCYEHGVKVIDRVLKED